MNEDTSSLDAELNKAQISEHEHESLPDSSGLEKGYENTPASELKLDKHGQPLVPQPSRYKDDPLNWPSWLKWAVLLQVSFIGLLGPFNCAVINPSLVTLSKALEVDSVTAAYNSTTAIIFGGVMAFFWMPLTNVYGRRPIVLICLLFATAGSIGSALSPTFKVLLGTRVINGIGISGMMAVGNAVVNDIFFLHERGMKTGIFTVFLTNGAHVAVLFGGFLAQAAGWQWDFWVPALCDAASLVVAIFLFPETLFSRHPNFLQTRNRERSYFEMLFDLKGNLIPQRKATLSMFLHPIRMMRYPSICYSAIYYCLGWTFTSTMPAVTIATTFTATYGFSSGVIGLCLGLSLTIGSVLAELTTGRISDIIIYRDSLKHNGIRRPEARLYLTWVSVFTMGPGLIIYGFCIQYKTHYMGPLVGLAISIYGFQVASTCLYAYVSDCYKPQTMESGVLFNMGRGLAFVVGYFAIPFAKASGYGWAWFTFAILTAAGFIPIALLIFYGGKWRARIPEPSFDRYI